MTLVTGWDWLGETKGSGGKDMTSGQGEWGRRDLKGFVRRHGFPGGVEEKENETSLIVQKELGPVYSEVLNNPFCCRKQRGEKVKG